MPEPPPGEAQLQKLGERFAGVDAAIGVWLAEAAVGDRRKYMTKALEGLTGLRRLDHRAPVVAAYLAEHPEGRASAVKDLADSLAVKLDRGAVSAADAVRQTFPKVTAANIAEMAEKTTIAHVDRRGAKWSLGWWSMTNTTTTGRAATSRGVIDSKPSMVTIEVSGCSYCQEFEGTYAFADVPGWPPFHPSCTCVASA